MIKLLCVGKIKEDYLEKLIDDYKKRINKYVKLEIVELKDDALYEKEVESILKNMKDSDYNIALDPRGEVLSSEEFSKCIFETLPYKSNITFIIGGSLGINDEIRKKADKIISFSKLTFPHGLFRGILLEQIYRACKINNNESYHK